MKHLKKFESYSSNRVDELLDKINDRGIGMLLVVLQQWKCQNEPTRLNFSHLEQPLKN
jgi:hypothetical protein